MNFWKNAAVFFTVIGFFSLFFMVLIEYISGCGESYVDAWGKRHFYECVILPNKGEKNALTR